MNAQLITALLATRHSEDVFIPECKTGASVSGYLRLDAWVMKKAWSKPLTIGYEIKVSRQDFMNDDKWHRYMEYCNEFYFVCPHGLILADELPDGVGLIYVTKPGTKLYMKKKAKRRDVDIPENLFRYALMARSVIVAGGMTLNENNIDRAEYWRNWLVRKEENRALGFGVSRAIQDHVDRVERENKDLKSRMDTYDEVIRRLEELDLPVDKPVGTWAINREIDKLLGKLPPAFEFHVKQAVKGMQELLTEMKA